MSVSIDRTAKANELAELAESLELLADDTLSAIANGRRSSPRVQALALHAGRQLRTLERICRDPKLEPDLGVMDAYIHAAELTINGLAA